MLGHLRCLDCLAGQVCLRASYGPAFLPSSFARLSRNGRSEPHDDGFDDAAATAANAADDAVYDERCGCQAAACPPGPPGTCASSHFVAATGFQVCCDGDPRES